MGSYLTQSGGSIAAATGDLTDDVGNDLLAQLCPDGAGGISSARVARIILKAEGRINVMLAPLYSTSITPVPEIIRTIAAQLFVYYAYEGRPEFATRDGKNPAQSRFTDANDLLKAFKESKPPLMDVDTRDAAAQLNGVMVESDDVRGWDDDSSTYVDSDGGGLCG